MFSFRRALALLPVFMTINMVMAVPIPGNDTDKTSSPITQSHEVTRKINGKDIQLEKLQGLEQIPDATTYTVVDGWDGKPAQAAIVRIGQTKEKKLKENIERSIDLLKDHAVELLYHSEWNDQGDSKWEYVIVTKDMRQNYPSEGAPELARLHEWLDKDPKMDLAAAVDQVRKAAIKKAEGMAESIKIVFRDISPYTVWTNKEHNVVYFDVYLDGVRIEYGTDSEEGKKALEDMRKRAKENYTEDSVRKALEDGTDV